MTAQETDRRAPADAGIELLLAGVHEYYGYDFTHYSRPSLIRRIERARERLQVPDYRALLEQVKQDKDCFDMFLRTLSISVTEMFRDPLFFRSVRAQILPALKKFPFLKIWHAGCATGEEVYSLAILLHEEGLLDRACIYATDFNKNSLERAARGAFPIKDLPAQAANYKRAGGRHPFLGYYNRLDTDTIHIADFLRKRIIFSHHNLVGDGGFGEMNLILCRNVLIYFDRILQNQVLSQFAGSLCSDGFLCLGSKETLNFAAAGSFFNIVDAKQRIYRKSEAIGTMALAARRRNLFSFLPVLAPPESGISL